MAFAVLTECHLYAYSTSIYIYIVIIYTHVDLHHNFQHHSVQPPKKKQKKQTATRIPVIPNDSKILGSSKGEFEDRLGNASQAVPTDVEFRRPLAPTRKCLMSFFYMSGLVRHVFFVSCFFWTDPKNGRTRDSLLSSLLLPTEAIYSNFMHVVCVNCSW